MHNEETTKNTIRYSVNRLDPNLQRFTPDPEKAIFTTGKENNKALTSTPSEFSQIPKNITKYTPAPTYDELFFRPAYYQEQGRKMDTLSMPTLTFSVNPLKLSVDRVSDYENGEIFEVEGKVCLMLNNVPQPITNFTVRILERVVKHSPNNDEKFLNLRIYGAIGSKDYLIKEREFLQLPSKLEKDMPGFVVIATKVTKASQYVKIYLSQMIEKPTYSVPAKDVFTYAGWQNLNGNWRYLSGIDAICESKRKLVDIPLLPQSVLTSADEFAWDVLSWGDIRVMLPVFLHSFTGIFYRFFKEAGRPIQYILNLCGPTNIGKSMLCQLLLRPFDPERKMANFTATLRGVELYLSENRDSVAVIDDLSSALDKRAMLLLESILRQYCDGNGRMIYDVAGGDLRNLEINFGLAISSENPLEGLKQSSQLRIITVNMTKNSLSELGDKKRELLGFQGSVNNLWDIFLTKFIRFVEANSPQIINLIQTFEAPNNFEFRRHIEVYNILLIIAQIVLNYFEQVSIISTDQTDEKFADWSMILERIISDNQKLSESSDPVRVFLTLLTQGISQNLINIAINKKCFEESPEGYLGFWKGDDENELILDPLRVYAWINDRAISVNENINATPAELWRKMVDAKIANGYAEKGRKNPKALVPVSIKGKKCNMLSLSWVKVTSFINI